MMEAERRLRDNVNVTDHLVFVKHPHVERADIPNTPRLTSVTEDDYTADDYTDVLTLTTLCDL